MTRIGQICRDVLVGASLLPVGSGPAHAEKVVSIGLSEQVEGVGVGVILGEPTGFTAAWRPGSQQAADLGVAWSIPEERFHLHADYLFTLVSFADPAAPKVAFPLYVGVGPRLRLGSSETLDRLKKQRDSSLLALRIPVGLGIWVADVPVEGFVELVPVVGMLPETRFDFDAALGARVYFKHKQTLDPPAADSEVR